MRDAKDVALVRSTIELGHSLGFKVVAEGVEDQETLDRLKEFGCDLAQGYHISRPLPSAPHALAQRVTVGLAESLRSLPRL